MLLGGEPGHRFSERYRRSRPDSRLRRPLAIMGGFMLILAGLVMTVTPGPGLPALLLGAMLIAGESRRAALALDRLELAVRRQSPLLACGIAAPVVYIAADVVAARLYPGYSYRDQAVSELFAIGAPTSTLVVLLFSLSSLLYAAFAASVWRLQRAISCMTLANAVDALLLWNFFPMHMRGATPTFTDTMHAVLAVNPFVIVTLVIAAAAFRGWFRAFSVVTIVVVLAPAALAYSYVKLLVAGEPTPWLGITERLPQYAHHLWHAVLAIVLMSRGPSLSGRDGHAD